MKVSGVQYSNSIINSPKNSNFEVPLFKIWLKHFLKKKKKMPKWVNFYFFRYSTVHKFQFLTIWEAKNWVLINLRLSKCPKMCNFDISEMLKLQFWKTLMVPKVQFWAKFGTQNSPWEGLRVQNRWNWNFNNIEMTV